MQSQHLTIPARINPGLPPQGLKPNKAPGSPFVTIIQRYRILLLLGLLGYLMVVGVLAYFYGVSTTVWIFLALVVNVVLLACPLLFYRAEFGWTHPVLLHVFLVFLASHLVRTPLYVRGLQYHLALPGWSREQLATLVAYELLLASVALVAYYMGFFAGVTPPIPKLRFRSPPAIAFKAVIGIAASLVLFSLYVKAQGGVSSHLLSWAEQGRVDAIKGEGHWLKLARLGGLTALLWFAFDTKALRRPIFWVASIACLATNFLGSGSRSSVIFLLVVGTLVWIIRKRKIVPVRALMVIVLCLLILGSLGRLRRSLFRGEVDWGFLYSAGAVDSFKSVVDELLFRYGSLDSAYPVLARVPREIDFLYGSSYLTILALPIPRALWPEKPGTVGKLAGETFYGVKAGIPPGAVGEAYWNLHIPGVVLLFLLFGTFHRWMARFFIRYRQEPGAIVLYCLTVFWSQPSVSATAEWIYIIVSVLFLLWIGGALRFSSPSPRHASAELDYRRSS